MASNRVVHIDVVFNVIDVDGGFGGSATYNQASCQPAGMGNVVDSDGSIHLDRANNVYRDGQNEYAQNVDFVFTLNPTTTGDHQFDVAWATKYGTGMTIVPPEDGGSPNEMVVQYNPANPQLIIIVDKDDDVKTYNYKPAVELIREDHDNYYISLDPRIVNRPR